MLEKAIENLQAEKQRLLDQAEQIIAEYWIWFQSENERIIQLINTGQTTTRPAQIAPLIEKKRSAKDAHKNYIVWKRHSRKFAEKIGNTRASLAIHKYTDLNPVSSLNKCTWERARALETEQTLYPLRVSLEGLHQAEVKLRAAMRKLSKTKEGVSQ